jgi:hypothetical protein
MLSNSWVLYGTVIHGAMVEMMGMPYLLNSSTTSANKRPQTTRAIEFSQCSHSLFKEQDRKKATCFLEGLIGRRTGSIT